MSTSDDECSVDRDSTDDDYSAASSHIETEVIAAAETKAANWSRLLFISVLVLSMVCMAGVVYFIVSDSEQDKFEDSFQSDVQKVFDAIAATLDHTLGAADSFMVAMVSFAELANETWPFVTCSNFAVHAAKLQSLTKAVVVSKFHFVQASERSAWEEYAATHHSWVDEGLQVEAANPFYEGTKLSNWTASYSIYSEGIPLGSGPYFPAWQTAPIVSGFAPYNLDLYSSFKDVIEIMNNTQTVVIGSSFNTGEEPDESAIKYISGLLGPHEDPTQPVTNFYYPIIEGASDVVSLSGTTVVENVDFTKTDKAEGASDMVSLSDTSSFENSNTTKRGRLVGVMMFCIFWRELIKDILPPGNNGIVIVIGNGCNQTFTYEIMGPQVKYLGSGDKHDSKYDSKGVELKFSMLYQFSQRTHDYTGLALSDEYCHHWMKAYPSQTMEDEYTTSNPIHYAAATVLIFVFTSIVFVLYDYYNDRRQKMVMMEAVRSSAIVSSLFPSNVRDRLYEVKSNNEVKSKDQARSRLQSFLSPHAGDDHAAESTTANLGPIADVFPATTVLFADIAGFTAWSSVREPTQVFTLLETLYGAFDAIAKKRHVFKVETIGDSYVAVTGLPEPNPDHALVMARFARDCRDKMAELVHELEIRLGPGTGDLQLRFGLHSGPVTAGVLRGAKSRFQLFGDTVNTASRMESNGIKGRIHVSQSTADLLIAAGRQHWVTKREELIEAKGKGKMQTYWVEPKSSSLSLSNQDSSGAPLDLSAMGNVVDDKTQRMIDWNVDVLSRLLHQIIANREVRPVSRKMINGSGIPDIAKFDAPLDGVKDIINFPITLNDSTELRKHNDSDLVRLDVRVDEELRNYVSTVAKLYRPHPFHNFEHAAHVTMSLLKLFSRIATASTDSISHHDTDGNTSVHDYLFGITSDSLTQFACVFATLIHNVDHPGLSNTQLVKKQSTMAAAYKNHSIVEQNSFDVAWNLLMDDSYRNLRETLFADDHEMQYVRQLVVNLVMATDYSDHDLRAARQKRFMEAFSEQAVGTSEAATSAMNRKATVALEYMIQTSVLAHTMQHSHIYLKWNERMFEEVYNAFVDGHGDTDPSTHWYTTELHWFDSCVIPLAQTLKDSGIFGDAVTSEEYLTNALKNREEWMHHGHQGTAEMTQKVKSKLKLSVC